MPKSFHPLKTTGPPWQVQTAKEQSSEAEQLAVQACQPKSLVQFFRESPLVGLELDFERDRDTGTLFPPSC